jgi:hypothetical protein
MKEKFLDQQFIDDGFNFLGLKDTEVDKKVFEKIWKEQHTKVPNPIIEAEFAQPGIEKWNPELAFYSEVKELFDNRFLKSKLFGVKKKINKKIYFFLDCPSWFFRKPPKFSVTFQFAPSICGFSTQLIGTASRNGVDIDFMRSIEFDFKEILENKEFTIVFCLNYKPNLVLNYSCVFDEKKQLEQYNYYKNNFLDHNNKIHSLLILDNEILDPHLDPEDKLKIGWASIYKNTFIHCDIIRRSRSNIEKLNQYFSVQIKNSQDENIKTGFLIAQSILNGCIKAESTWVIPKIFHGIYKDIKIRKSLMSIFYGSTTNTHKMLGQLSSFFNFYIFSEIFSDYGMKMPCLDLTEPNEIKSFEIDYMNLPNYPLKKKEIQIDKFTTYWRNYFNSIMGSQHYNGDMIHVLEPFDTPLAVDEFVDRFKNLHLEDSSKEVEKLCTSLLEEANASKNWVMNNGSYFALKNFGPFKAVQIYEIYEDLNAKFITDDHFYYYLSINFKTLSTNRDSALSAALGEEKAKEITLALKQMVCVLVRDYWVVERKESVFEERKVKDYFPNKYNHKDKPYRVVYLPRVVYEKKKQDGVRTCYNELNYAQRSKHAVRAHVRISKNISPLQKFLANRYNIDVPENHTFVQPHYRGETIEQKIIYRSRSAMQMIYNTSDNSSTKTNDYFKFEVDVKNYFENNNYIVRHYSANKRNDGGIDVVATKNIKDKQLTYLIQCKCYKRKLKIGPNIVRELIGSMAGYNDECEGIIITTSYFTRDAELERDKNFDKYPIKFIDGDKLAKLI